MYVKLTHHKKCIILMWNNSTKCPRTVKCEMFTIYTLLVPLSPKYHPILLLYMTNRFPVSFKCTKWLQNDLDHYDIKGTHICPTSAHESQIAISFSLRPVLFELHMPFLDRGTEWPWTRDQGRTIHVYDLQLPPSPNCYSLLLYGQPFSSHFETSALNDPKVTFNNKRQT